MAIKFRMLLLHILKANDKVRHDGLIFMLCQIEQKTESILLS